MLDTSAITYLFPWGFPEHYCYLSLSFSISKTITSTLFVVFLLVNTLFLVFCGNSICKYVRGMYIVAV